MARPLRLEFAGALYHITSRGDRRENIYEDDADRRMFMSLLDQVSKSYNWRCHAYCLMDNHYHLLVETPEGNLSQGMRQLNGVYTQNYNRIHNRAGHVFQGRYKAILVEKQSYLLELSRYIVLNPVRAEMVRSAIGWPWSSYRATIGQCTAPYCLTTDWILAAFSNRKSRAIELYKKFVKEGRRQTSPWLELKNQIYLGSDTFIEKIQKHIVDRIDLSEIPASQKRPVLKTLQCYEQRYQTRNIAIINAYQSGGYTLKQIGNYFGLHYSTVSGIIRDHKSKT